MPCRQKVQRSMIPVAARPLQPMDNQHFSTATSIPNLSSLSKQQKPSQKVSTESGSTHEMVQVRSIRSISKSESSLSESILSVYNKNRSTISSEFDENDWKFNQLNNHLEDRETDSNSSHHSSQTKNITSGYFSSVSRENKTNNQINQKSLVCQSDQIWSSHGASVCKTASDLNKRSNTSKIQNQRAISGASLEIGSHGKNSISVKLKKCNSVSSNDANTDKPTSSSSLVLPPNGAHNSGLQLERQLQEKDLQIVQLMKVISEKESLLDSLYFEMDDKDQRIEELMDEIRKRKQDMAEMSRKIISLDRELKAYQSGQIMEYSASVNQANRPFSQLSNESCPTEQVISSNRWFKMTPLRTFKKSQNKGRTVTIQRKSNGEYVQELKSILKEKEMIITDLRLESKLTNHRLEELENALRRREEETLEVKNSFKLVKRTNEYLEKAMKSKMLD